MLFIKMIIFFLCLINFIVCLSISFVILMWFSGILLNVELIILLLIECLMFVIFLGCLLIRRIINFVLGWFVVMLLVIFFNSIVLFVFGGVIISFFCLNLIGEIKLIICVEKFFGWVFSSICLFG